MKTQPNWLNKNMFPFESRWIEVDEHQMHYIDEGSGPIILFAHGTPEWSFAYRDLIKDLRSNFRCIAFDMLGFGLSDKARELDYSCQAHSRRLGQAIEKLNLKNITLFANDFGGGISLAYAIKNSSSVRSVVLFNTWMWSLKNDTHYSTPAKVMNTAFGRFMYMIMNFPVNVVMPAAYGDKRKLTKEIHSHYKKALPKGDRTAAYQFAKELMNASDWWERQWENLGGLRGKPFLIFWGLKDKFVPSKELDKWKSKLPEAKVVTFADGGHFLHEEKADEMVTEIRRFMNDPVTVASTQLT
jgi:pimeloyl-ACP methyl ester carboxylesterase